MEWMEKRGIWALVAVLAPFYLFLPFSQQTFYASPDETASVVMAREMAWYGHAFIQEPLAREFPWLHPRSFVSLDEKIVPIGFLAWPWIMSLFVMVLGMSLVPFLSSLAILSTAYPLYRLMKPFGSKLALMGTAVAMTFPGLMVFGNRGMFAQIALLVFGIWSLFLLKQLKRESHVAWFGLAGFLVMMTIASRPTEILWVVPWLVWAGWDLVADRKSQVVSRKVKYAIIGALIPILFLGYHAQVTYGGFWKMGYLMRDNAVAVTPSVPLVLKREASNALPLSTRGDGGVTVGNEGVTVFPFGIHPLNVARNVFSFLGLVLWPWTLVLAAAAYFVYRECKKNARAVVPSLCAWTVMWLVFYYGQGLYADNILGGATIANSFVRYLLPIAPIVGLGFVYAAPRLLPLAFPLLRMRRGQGEERIVAIAAFVLVIFGLWTAFSRDAEGLLTTRSELLRYAGVRAAALASFRPTDVILSERSDKIFFPAMRAVSPLPEAGEVRRLSDAHPDIRIGLYARPLSQSQSDEWRRAGFDPVELGVFSREKLYLLQPMLR